MMLSSTFVAALFSFFCCVSINAEKTFKTQFNYEIKRYTVPVDHFDFANNATFEIRYLYNSTYSDGHKYSPLFFYTGNEGDIELFAQNTGFLWELAEKFQACVVFAEHRYYGKSLPFGDKTFNTTENIGYLTVEQTLEDFVSLINFLWGEKTSPVIAFGGSYGGMLSAWIRMKYPHIVYGALAASAPIWQFNGITPCDIFSKITTSVFTNAYNKNCSANIKESWKLFRNLSTSDDGRNTLNAAFKFCDPPKRQEDIDSFMDYLGDVYENLAMANYPYSNDFLSPLPGYPVREFCYRLRELHEGKDLLNAMVEAVSIYSNYTGTLKCLDYKSAYDPALGGSAWDIQTCNQMVMPMCSNENDSMFRKEEWDFKAYSEKCHKRFGISPSLDDIIIRYGGKHIQFASNIIFSNGLQDPWSGGGVLRNVNDKIKVIIIPEGAHHLDLRSSNPSDPASVVDARNHEIEIISGWISEYFKSQRYFYAV